MTIYADIQTLEPGALIELLSIDSTSLGGSVEYFHGYTQIGNITWQSQAFNPWPMQTEGFEKTGDQQPVPKLRVGNVDGSISALCLSYDDLVGAIITRHRTLGKYLDAVNFPPLTARSEPFALNSGSSNVATLTIGGKAVTNPTVTAIHQTDWQGRVALSNQLRTNYLPYSDYASSYWINNSSANDTITTGVAGPDGSNSAVSIACTTAQSHGLGVYLNQFSPPTGVTPGQTYTLSVWAKTTVAGSKLIIQGVTTNAALYPTFSLTTSWQRFTFTVQAGGSGQSYAWGAPAFYISNATVGQTIQLAHVMLTDATTGAYIPTTAAAATVTDYTQAGNQITFGQNPAIGATLDWDGSGYYNPTADPTQELPPDTWFIERKSSENNEAVEFELSSALNFNGVELPRRQIIANLCAWVAIGSYRGPFCGYTGGPVADINDNPTTDPSKDQCSGSLKACKMRFSGVLPFGGFPASGMTRT